MIDGLAATVTAQASPARTGSRFYGRTAMFRLPRRALVAVPALALVMTASACSGGGKTPDSSTDSSGGGQVAGTPRVKIAMISHAPVGDAFFDTIIKGAKAAAAKDNVDFTYSGDGDAAEQATLVQTA
ncbi:MAG: hypothetical protein WB441_05350, partial [Nocardioidaceae bacterium]